MLGELINIRVEVALYRHSGIDGASYRGQWALLGRQISMYVDLRVFIVWLALAVVEVLAPFVTVVSDYALEDGQFGYRNGM